MLLILEILVPWIKRSRYSMFLSTLPGSHMFYVLLVYYSSPSSYLHFIHKTSSYETMRHLLISQFVICLTLRIAKIMERKNKVPKILKAYNETLIVSLTSVKWYYQFPVSCYCIVVIADFVICDWVCRNQMCRHIKVTTFSTLLNHNL